MPRTLPVAVEPAPAVTVGDIPPPECLRCGKLCSLRVAGPSNRKGNAGRPYYICNSCCKFSCFADLRGCRPQNPRCDCGCPSRMQIDGREQSPPGGLHYVCQWGTCHFDRPCVDEDQKQMCVVDDAVVYHMVKLGLI
ncbi:hypothetical protein LY78DRAFT_234981 [Colletotrichum sublineola]|nr:hypothetical protein LY78DRAFT_234981 [Colletotrichum sublineola]